MTDGLDFAFDSQSSGASSGATDADSASVASISPDGIESQLPPENVELLHAVLELSGQPDLLRTRLYAALLGATYLVPLARAIDPEHSEGEEVSLELLSLTGSDGRTALPVFTHQEALALWAGRDQPAAVLPGEVVFQITAGSSFDLMLVNPAGPFRGQIQRSEFEPLSRGLLPGTQAPATPDVAPGQSIFIDLPLVPVSGDTLDKVRSMLEKSPAVRSAHLFLMQVGPESAPRLTLGIHAEGPASQWAIPHLSRQFRNEALSFDPYEAPDLLLLDSVSGAEAVRSAVPPLFSRSAGSGPARGDTGEGSGQAGAREDATAARGQGGIADSVEPLVMSAGQSPAPLPDLNPRPRRSRRSLWPFKGRE